MPQTGSFTMVSSAYDDTGIRGPGSGIRLLVSGCLLLAAGCLLLAAGSWLGQFLCSCARIHDSRMSDSRMSDSTISDSDYSGSVIRTGFKTVSDAGPVRGHPRSVLKPVLSTTHGSTPTATVANERASEPTRTERADEAARERACGGVRGAKPLGVIIDSEPSSRAQSVPHDTCRAAGSL